MNTRLRVKTLFLLLLISYTAFGQSPVSRPASNRVFGNEKTSDSDYLLSIEKTSDVLQTAYNEAEFSGSTFRLLGEMDNTLNKLQLILKSLQEASPNVRNQQMYHRALMDIKSELDAQNNHINSANLKLAKIRGQITGLQNNATLMELIGDTIRRTQFGRELLDLQTKYNKADSLLQSNTTILSAKKRLTVERKIMVSNALVKVEDRLEQSGISLFKREYPVLWQSKTDIKKNELSRSVKSKLAVEKGVVAYYTNYSITSMTILVFLMLLIAWYLSHNIKYLRKKGYFDELVNFNFKYLNKGIVAPVIIIGLNIAIVTNLYAPALFTELLQLGTLMVLTIMFQQDWSKSAMRNWLFLITLFVILCFLDLFLKVSFIERCIFILVNILGIRYGFVQLKSIQDQLYIKGFFKWARIIFISFNIIALLLNIFGRVSLAQTISITAIVALTQIIALSVLLKIILEIILLQIYTTRVKRGLEKIFDHESLSDNLKKPFTVVISYMWLVVIAANLNIWELLYNSLSGILTHPITIGSVTFTLGGIVLFAIIIWLAHLLQKYVAYFFGEIEDDENTENINKRQHSKLLVTRLTVLIVGYLIAIAASGMPLDKLSIVLGALGVGIGLGLQNIVNNFVSGIILIFDKPIQVGDIIDVSAQSGRVKSMGLRTTKINAPNGAEIIIPNGTILSQNITNWTYTDNLKLVDISFSITGDITTEKINDMVHKALTDVPLVDSTKELQIYYNALSDNNYKILVKFWCSIYRTEEAISSTKQLLYKAFKVDGITFTT